MKIWQFTSQTVRRGKARSAEGEVKTNEGGTEKPRIEPAGRETTEEHKSQQANSC